MDTLKANYGLQASGVGDKRFSVLSQIRSICEQPLCDIILMILYINKSYVLLSDQNSEYILSPFKGFPMLGDTHVAFSLPVEHDHHETTDSH